MYHPSPPTSPNVSIPAWSSESSQNDSIPSQPSPTPSSSPPSSPNIQWQSPPSSPEPQGSPPRKRRRRCWVVEREIFFQPHDVDNFHGGGRQENEQVHHHCDIVNSSQDSVRADSTDSESDSSCDSEEESNSDCESEYESESDDEDSDDEDSDLEVYAGCEFSVDEAVLDLFSDSIKNCESKKSLEDHLKTFLKYLPKGNNMPKTYHQLEQYVENLVPYNEGIAHPYCSQCFLYCTHENVCRACGCSEKKYMYMFSLEEQLRFYFENCNLAEVVDLYEQQKTTDGHVRDIVDGTEYRRVKVNEKYSLTLILNTDGVHKRRGSTNRLWPVMCTICEVPPLLRKRYMIMCGVWHDSRDPPMSTLLKPVVDAVNNIDRNGGVSWTHPESHVAYKSKVTVPLVCADAPARAKVQNIISHNGEQGCNTCEQKMEKIPLTAQEQAAKTAGQKIRCKRGYFYKELPARLRSDVRMRLHARRAVLSNRKAEGVKGPSIVGHLPKLDLSKCVYAEYMHGVCLGVTKHFLKIWLTTPGDWNLSDWTAEMDSFMKTIQPPNEICRVTRPVSDWKYWKASEFRNWLLFYSLPCIAGKLPHEYVEHWSLLVVAIFNLLKDDITVNDINEAEVALKCFVADVERLYRRRHLVYNVHQLLHLTLYVKWWGPLWNSAFIFESYNGNIVNLIHGTKNPGKELMKNIRIAHGVQILQNKVHGKPDHAKNNCNRALTLVKYPNIDDDRELLESFGVITHELSNCVFSRVKRGREIFTSKVYSRAKKRSNYTVKFKSSTESGFGDIKYFIEWNDELFAVVKKFSLNIADRFAHRASGVLIKHIIPVQEVYLRTVLIKVDEISMKMIRVGNTICYQPNNYEKNL